jgi:hypothetical protein
VTSTVTRRPSRITLKVNLQARSSTLDKPKNRCPAGRFRAPAHPGARAVTARPGLVCGRSDQPDAGTIVRPVHAATPPGCWCLLPASLGASLRQSRPPMTGHAPVAGNALLATSTSGVITSFRSHAAAQRASYSRVPLFGQLRRSNCPHCLDGREGAALEPGRPICKWIFDASSVAAAARPWRRVCGVWSLAAAVPAADTRALCAVEQTLLRGRKICCCGRGQHRPMSRGYFAAAAVAS